MVKFKQFLKTLFKGQDPDDPKYTEGRLAFSNGLKMSDNPYGRNNELSSKWESGWTNAYIDRKTYEKKSGMPKVYDTDWGAVYEIGGLITAIITFIACWISVIIWSCVLMLILKIRSLM
jgi:hypothetical protein